MAFWRDRMHYACVAWEGLTKPWRRALAWLALFDLALALASARPSFSPSGHVAVLEIDRRAQIRNSLLPFRKSSTVHRPRCRAVCSLQFWRGLALGRFQIPDSLRSTLFKMRCDKNIFYFLDVSLPSMYSHGSPTFPKPVSYIKRGAYARMWMRFSSSSDHQRIYN